MNSLRLRLFLVLALGLACLLGGAWWLAPAWRALSEGERRPARLAAMLRLRADGADLISGLRHEITVVCRNGDRVRALFINYEPVSLETSGADASAPAASDRFTGEAGRELLDRIARGGVEDLRRILMREARERRPESIAGLEKTETATGAFGLAHRPTDFRWDGAGPVAALDLAPADAPRELRSAVLFGTLAEARQPRTDGAARKLAEPFFVRADTEPAAPRDRNDFVLFSGGHVTEYRPVLAYHGAAGAPRAVLADLGKVKGESSAFRLFGSAFVVDAPGHTPLLVADLSSLGADKSLLTWFSSASEAVFSRWVYPAIFWAFGLAILLFCAVAFTVPASARPPSDSLSPSDAELPSRD